MTVAAEPIRHLEQQIAPHRQRLVEHGLYARLRTLDDLRRFMEYHVFAVWDFMSLLKALQREFTCVTLPWMPTPNPAVRRLINEIVLEEESDVDRSGQPISHFELYLRAMRECGADTAPIQRLLAALADGQSVSQALRTAEAPDSVRQFVETTFDIIAAGSPHAIAAAFTFGREDLIPDMFRRLVQGLSQRFPGQLDTLAYYLNRHIELDEEVHTPLAQQMVRELCGDEPGHWEECQQVAARCMAARVALWDGIVLALATGTRKAA